MEYQRAADILRDVLIKRRLNAEEKEAVQTAIGLLMLAIISDNQLKNRLKKQKAEQDRRLKW
jgi:hypothetical protein